MKGNIHNSEFLKLEKAIKDAEFNFELARSILEALKKTLADFKRFNKMNEATMGKGFT